MPNPSRRPRHPRRRVGFVDWETRLDARIARRGVATGIHFVIQCGLALGPQIGCYAVETLFQPTDVVTSASR